MTEAFFVPGRLKMARQRMGYTMTRLAVESDVSLRSLTGYENDEQVPSEETLAKLASILNVRQAFFMREALDSIPVASVSFRKLTKTSAIKRDAVLASARLGLTFAAEIEAKFRLPEVQIPTLDKFNPELSAEMLRQRWELGSRPISNMIHLLESRGVRILAITTDHKEIDAFSFWRDEVPYIFLNTTKSGERQRFDAAHELGHLILHAEQNLETSDSKEREAQANAFAASLLMPRDGVLGQSMSEPSIERILAAKEYWRVSAMALTHRLHELRLMGDWTYRTTCQTLSERGYRSSEPGGIVPENSQLLKKVLFMSQNKLSLRDTAAALDIHPDELRGFLAGLVPVSA